MTAGQRGDGLAYAELLAMLVPIARRYALNRVGPRSCAEDIVQETLVSIHRARQTYDARRPFAPWFYAVLSSRLIDVMRRERRIDRREQGRDTLPERPVPAWRGQAVDMARVREALLELPARQREVVTALKLEERSVREVGIRLGMSESAVKVTAHRGYRALRRMLGVMGRDH
jgi:RNA polymerase sigma-70 factor (ECF subfamily)